MPWQSKWKHRNYGPNQLRQIEQCVQGLIVCMLKFDPTSPKKFALYNQPSQLAAHSNLVHAAKIDKLLEKKRVYSKTIFFHAFVPLSKC